MAFYGFQNAAHMRECLGGMAESVLSLPTTSKAMRVCSKHAKCNGSSGGVFYYDDGTTDAGVEQVTLTATAPNGDVFQWGKQ